MEDIGKRMRRLRVEAGLSSKEVAERAGIAISTYREWEIGRQIKGEPYEKLASALDVTLYELITGKKPDQKQMLHQIQAIEKACAALKETLSAL